MNSSKDIFLAGLDRVRGYWRLGRAVEGVILAIGVTCGVLLLSVLYDRWDSSSTFVRYNLAINLYLTLPYVLFEGGLKHAFFRKPDEFFAGLVQAKNASIGDCVMEALKISRGQALDRPVDERESEAILSRAAAAVGKTGIGMAGGRKLIYFTLTSILCVTSMMIYLSNAGPAGRTSMDRVLMPWAAIPPYTTVDLIVEPAGEVEVDEGESLAFRAKAAYRPGEKGAAIQPSIHWTIAGKASSATMTAHPPMGQEPAHFIHRFDSINQEMDIHISAGDAASNPVRVKLRARRT